MKKFLGVMLAVVMLSAVCVCAAPVDMQIDMTNASSRVVGLRTDGTINSFGYNFINNTPVSELKGAVQVACEDFADNSFFVLMEDGTVKEFAKFAKNDFKAVAGWTDIVAIDGGNGVLAGLKSDGTVAVAGSNASLYKKASSWTDIKSIYAKEDCLIGITNEGKAVATGVIGMLDKQIANWTNLKKVVFDLKNFWGITNDGDFITTDVLYKKHMIAGGEAICNIADFETMSAFKNYSRLVFLTEEGTLYEMENYTSSNGNFKLKKLYEDVQSVVSGGIYYAAVLKDGEIVSDKITLSSDDWILGIDIRVGGKYVDCDVQPYIKNDRTMVPIRAISEALGAEVGYDDATKTAIITKDGKTVKVTMDSSDAYVDDTVVALDAPAENVGGRIFVPVRFVSEGLGCSVKWVAETKSVIIE